MCRPASQSTTLGECAASFAVDGNIFGTVSSTPSNRLYNDLLAEKARLSHGDRTRAVTGLCVTPRPLTYTNKPMVGLTVARTHSTSYLHGKGDPEPWWEVSNDIFCFRGVKCRCLLKCKFSSTLFLSFYLLNNTGSDFLRPNSCFTAAPWQVDLGSNRSVGTVVLWDAEPEPIMRQFGVQEISVMFDDGRGYADASVVEADTASSFTLTYVPALSVFNPDHPMYCKTYDCHNVCNGKAVLDVCDVCGGDGSSCSGCLDKTACTYAVDAKVHDQSLCVYALAHHDCFGDCTEKRDCGGGCGGAPSAKLGRYVTIGNLRSGQQLNLNEVIAYDHRGSFLQPQAATLSSTMTPDFAASNCIEVKVGQKDTAMCHAARTDANPWLRVDYGKPVDIRRLVVTNRIENNCCRDRIVGATISVATDAAGTDVIWSGKFQAEQQEYVWTQVGLRPSLTLDKCGVCDGDESTCTGCMDTNGCNFEPEAKVAGPCTYAEVNHNCYEHCTTFTDCAGNCGGSLSKDACGVCGGDSSTCTGGFGTSPVTKGIFELDTAQLIAEIIYLCAYSHSAHNDIWLFFGNIADALHVCAQAAWTRILAITTRRQPSLARART